MRTAEFVRMAKEGRPVYISDVRRAFDADKEKVTSTAYLTFWRMANKAGL